MALARAARLTALAEAAAANSADSNSVVRLDGAASRARRDLEKLLDADIESQASGYNSYAMSLVRGA
jgi:glyoxylate carboligase